MSRCRNTLSLLRTQLPHRSLFTGLPCLPSASHSISNPSLPSPRSHLPPQSTATSSRYTLDHPFWFDRPDAYTSALGFATDDELFHSLLLPTPDRAQQATKGKARQDDWTATFDPALAFLALRSRPTYTAFLQCIHPFLDTVYPRLKAAKQHQLLVSDLLLRHPDPRLLRDLLELDAQTIARRYIRPSSNANAGAAALQHLRPSLVASIHSIIGWQIRRGSIEALSYRSHVLVTRSIAAQDDISGLIQAWNDLRVRSPHTKEAAYLLLTFVLKVVRSDPVAAFGMLHSLVRNDKLPRGILLRGLGEHARRREILVLGAVIKSCLHWRMEMRSRTHAGQLLDLILDGNGQAAEVQEAVELVLEVCRGAGGAQDLRGLEWCTSMFLKMATADSGPPIPGALFDAWLEAIFAIPHVDFDRPKTYPLDVWVSLPPHRRPPISAQNILRLATLSAEAGVLVSLLSHLSHLDPSTTLPIATPLLTLVLAQDIPSTDRRRLFNILLHHWSGSQLILKGPDLIQLVKPLRADKARCTAIMKIYEARLLNEHHRRGEISVEEALAMVHTYLLVKEYEDAEAWVEGMELSDEVKWGLWEMGLGNGSIRVALKRMLRKRCEPGEVKRILEGNIDRSVGGRKGAVDEGASL